MRDAVREIESHLRERVLSADGAPNEREALEKILAELGPPLRVAQAYSAERTIDEAVATGRFVPIVRAVWHLAVDDLIGFCGGARAVRRLSVTSFAFLAIAVLKPIFPEQRRLSSPCSGVPVGFGAQFPLSPGRRSTGGYWIIPFALFCGVGGLRPDPPRRAAVSGLVAKRRRVSIRMMAPFIEGAHTC